MQVSISDRMTFGDRQTTADGYLATVCKLARSGCYEYLGSELGRPDLPSVTVYRDDAEVFDEVSLRSFAYKPVTDDHPPVGVNSKNWAKYAKGQLGGKALRDGDHIEFPLVIMDQGLIDKINSGKVEVSAGYTADISFVDGIAPDGTAYQAKMSNIVGNHAAIVERGRAITARLGDAWPVEDSTVPPKKEVAPVKTILIDGVPYNQDNLDGVEAAVKKVEDRAAKAETALADSAKALTDAEAKAATELKDANEAKDKAEAKVASLEKELADSKITPERLRDAAKAYAKIVDGAAKIAADFKIEDSMTEQEIKKGAVLAALGDSYKDKSDAFFDAAFEIEVGKVKDAAPIDPYRAAMADRGVVDFADAAAKAKTAREKMIAEMTAPRGEAK